MVKLGKIKLSSRMEEKMGKSIYFQVKGLPESFDCREKGRTEKYVVGGNVLIKVSNDGGARNFFFIEDLKGRIPISERAFQSLTLGENPNCTIEEFHFYLRPGLLSKFLTVKNEITERVIYFLALEIEDGSFRKEITFGQFPIEILNLIGIETRYVEEREFQKMLSDFSFGSLPELTFVTKRSRTLILSKRTFGGIVEIKEYYVDLPEWFASSGDWIKGVRSVGEYFDALDEMEIDYSVRLFETVNNKTVEKVFGQQKLLSLEDYEETVTAITKIFESRKREEALALLREEGLKTRETLLTLYDYNIEMIKELISNDGSSIDFFELLSEFDVLVSEEIERSEEDLSELMRMTLT